MEVLATCIIFGNLIRNPQLFCAKDSQIGEKAVRGGVDIPQILHECLEYNEYHNYSAPTFVMV